MIESPSKNFALGKDGGLANRRRRRRSAQIEAIERVMAEEWAVSGWTREQLCGKALKPVGLVRARNRVYHRCKVAHRVPVRVIAEVMGRDAGTVAFGIERHIARLAAEGL